MTIAHAVAPSPAPQCFFITVTIFGGALYFQELNKFGLTQMIMFPIGVLVTLTGIVLLSQRDMSRSKLGKQPLGCAVPGNHLLSPQLLCSDRGCALLVHRAPCSLSSRRPCTSLYYSHTPCRGQAPGPRCRAAACGAQGRALASQHHHQQTIQRQHCVWQSHCGITCTVSCTLDGKSLGGRVVTHSMCVYMCWQLPLQGGPYDASCAQ